MADNTIARRNARLLASAITRHRTGDPAPTPEAIRQTIGEMTTQLRDSIPAD